jgi:hypothetical protein
LGGSARLDLPLYKAFDFKVTYFTIKIPNITSNLNIFLPVPNVILLIKSNATAIEVNEILQEVERIANGYGLF